MNHNWIAINQLIAINCNSFSAGIVINHNWIAINHNRIAINTTELQLITTELQLISIYYYLLQFIATDCN